ncbi:unnamed protein product [Prunus armeniaca]
MEMETLTRLKRDLVDANRAVALAYSEGFVMVSNKESATFVTRPKQLTRSLIGITSREGQIEFREW